MVSVVSRGKNGKKYYSLKHTTGNKQREKYLGLRIPKNIEEIKKEFLLKFYHEQWDTQISAITKNYQKETKSKPPSIKQKDFESFGISFTYNTQRMEGSSLTEADTRDLLVHGVTPTKKSQIDSIETKKHYDLFMKLVTSKNTKITKKTVMDWHKEIFDQTKIGEAGSIRTYRVGVITNDKIEFAPAHKIPERLDAFFKWLNKSKTTNFVELAALAHYYFVSIHPFGDGNGRISRMIMNYILFIHGCPFMQIKNNDRRTYFKALEKSQIKRDEIHFLKWFMRYYIKSNRNYLE
ncbi:MAG: Fic family protein [Nitrosopumilus sp.]|uniref:Fic family protein n=1 Tax=Nitrosopumilus sp. TaxID=2024843 RepID=UPI00242F8CFE|nr:Fic family protein [Nitrosopumilus sp.]MCV0367577.1 Fic family protein [Nitrosopumilus sp.]